MIFRITLLSVLLTTSAFASERFQVWPYNPSTLYQIHTQPDRVTDIVLQPGEELVDISAPDTNRWILGNTVSGKGADQRVHISVRPTRPGLQTNFIVYTSRRTYYLELISGSNTWVASVSWTYAPEGPISRTLTDTATSPTRLNFNYRLTGPKPPWRPVRVFDDGSKVYIEFPETITQTDMPPLFLLGEGNEPQIVNYRVQSPYYIVDRLFDRAELRMGGKNARPVRITHIRGSDR